MRRATLTLGLFLTVVTPLLADLRIAGELKVPVNRLVRLEAQGTVDGSALIWDVSNEDSVDAEEVGQRFLFTAPPGTYKIKLRSIMVKDGKTKVETARATVTIGDAPPNPIPPGPTPPNPTPPTPEPSSAPIPLPGFRVLIIYESGDTYPASTESILSGKKIRDYLKAKCVDEAGGMKGFWILDKDVDVSGLPKHWQDAWIRSLSKIAAWKPPSTPLNANGKPKGTAATNAIPWLLVSNGTTGYEGPLPSSVDETLALLKKFGG